jgi:valyl-tRNA synthetase
MEQKYDFTKVEKEMQEFWRGKDIYRYQNGKERKVFSIDTPPPTVSGKLHIGHVFSYVQGEMIARFKRMQGFDVFYPFGFDDNGLPTERLVEREEGIRAATIPGSEFREKCMGTVEKYEEEFRKMWDSLGFSVDWNLKYQTISDNTQRISQRSFLDLVRKRKAYMKESPVLWCTECATSIAQAELETKDCETTFNYLTFTTDEEPLLVATTRPELLYGCVCLLVNPKDERYARYVEGTASVPLYNFEIPIRTDEEVSMEKGTGVVMCATFGDSTDAKWYEKYQLPYKQVILANGRILEEVPYVGGLKVKAARERIIELLKEAGLLVRQENLTHSVAIHERCGKDVEIIPSRQWYIDVLSEKDRFLKAADEINWYPPYMKDRYLIWVENLKWDWCISRQRYFGVPFPVWYCKRCGEPIFATEESLPINPTESKPPHVCSCGCEEFVPEKAVFDTWATSSVTPLINSRYGEPDDRTDEIFPMGLRCQAHEIIRTWTFYTIVKSLYHTGKLPWSDIMISGFVLAKPGEKISKSKGNASESPQALIEKHSADVIRYWTANAKLGTDTFFSEADLKIAKRFLTKLWNASKFAIMHLEDFVPCEEVRLLPIDLWMLERVKQMTNQVKRLLDAYEIGQARHEVDNLFWKDFCDYYIEIIKERLYQPEKHGVEERYSGQYAVYYSLLGILKMYAIYTPHITEYIYQQYFHKYEEEISIHHMIWDTEDTVDRKILEFGDLIETIISNARKEKSERNLSLKDDMEELIIRCPSGFKEFFRGTEEDLKACTRAKRIIYRN